MTAAAQKTPADRLAALLTRTDRLSVDAHGALRIEGLDAARLLREFGSPLYVLSEGTLRDNYRRIRGAFTDAWPADVNIMYAIKANTTLAVRAVLSAEGAGGDCFSDGELHATFAAGAEPRLVALNGSNKSAESLRTAVERGVTINVDAESEIEALAGICRSLDRPARVNIRVKPLSDAYDGVATDYFGGAHLAEYVRRTKWGFSPGAACRLIRRIRDLGALHLTGLSAHVGRVSRDVAFYRHYGRAVGRTLTAICAETGFVPEVLDIGGGWPRARDPESRSLALNTTPVEDYAQAACGEILTELGARAIAVPSLWVEPGRFIIGNACVLLATVGTVKRDLGLCWVNVDAGTNELPRIETSGSAYHVLAASGMFRPEAGTAAVVGPTCNDAIVGHDVALPELHAGDVVAILDAGMYAESAGSRFNSLPRPATVLVDGTNAEIVGERESIDDVFARQRIPPRLLRA